MTMLIRDAEIGGHLPDGAIIADVRLAEGSIARIGRLDPLPGERIIEARGGALTPALHDHHIHLFALAASRTSLRCGPDDIAGRGEFAERLSKVPGTGWIRGIGYHEEVAGELSRELLDQLCPDRPVRIQHRGGRRWFVNSAALELLLEGRTCPTGLDVQSGFLDDLDGWLRERLAGTFPCLAETSALLAAYGIGGVTEMTPSNDAASLSYLSGQVADGVLRQRVLVAGSAALPEGGTAMVRPLLTKIHLHEPRLPDYAALVATIARSHERGRPVAIHCVTRTELVLALATLSEAGSVPGDRIEHASVAPDELIAQIAALGLHVVTQPNFIFERGDAYLRDVEACDVGLLYRAKRFDAAGIPLAAGCDAPFGDPDPWQAMRAAVERRTRGGAVMDDAERLSPERALALFLAKGDELGVIRRVEEKAPADLCLLDSPWSVARARLGKDRVRATLIGGLLVFEGIH